MKSTFHCEGASTKDDADGSENGKKNNRVRLAKQQLCAPGQLQAKKHHFLTSFVIFIRLT